MNLKQERVRSIVSMPNIVGEDLFAFFCDCVKLFIEEIVTEDAKLIDKNEPEYIKSQINMKRVLGFTFSFPVLQTAINEGSLMKWTKGFNASDVEGMDVVQILQKSFDSKVQITTHYYLIKLEYEYKSCGIGE